MKVQHQPIIINKKEAPLKEGAKKLGTNIQKNSSRIIKREFPKGLKKELAKEVQTEAIKEGAKGTLGLVSDAVKLTLSDEAKEKSTQDVVSSKEDRKELAEKELKKSIEKAKALKDISKIKRPALTNKPGIFFIGGLDMVSGVSGGLYDGIRLMSEAQEGAKHFSWSDKKEIIENIKKTAPGYPIVLVGHSYGGDTGVEIAQELNTLENGFRKIDLLVTIDSVGSNNDHIPSNVVKNLNFIGDGSSYLNDGPNIALNSEKTEVINKLVQKSHTELDDNGEVQADIMQEIRTAMLNTELSRL